MPLDPIGELRRRCLALPEVEERPFGGHTSPSWRVRDKLFCMVREDQTGCSLKAGPGVNDILVGDAPDRFFLPPYVGGKGWVGVRLDVDQDWDEVAGLVEDSYRLIAPKRLVRLLDGELPIRPGEGLASDR